MELAKATIPVTCPGVLSQSVPFVRMELLEMRLVYLVAAIACSVFVLLG